MVVMLVAVLAARSVAGDEPPRPSSLPPEIMVAHATEKDGGVIVKFSGTKAISLIKRAITVEKDGKKMELEVTAYEFSFYEIDVRVDGKEVKAFGVDGKAINPKELPKRLGKATQVAVVFHHPDLDPKLDPFYLRLMREDVVVFTGPRTKFMPPSPKK
jgi:hypothetical protein